MIRCSPTARTAAALLLALVGLLGGCDLVAPDDKRELEKIRLSETAFTLSAGATHTLEAVVLDGSGREVRVLRPGETIAWSSADTAIATVLDGNVTGRRIGETEIHANLGGLRASARVTVRPGGVVALSIGPDTISLVDPDSAQRTIAVTALDSLGNLVPDAAITWSSSDSAVAVVSSAGVVSQRGQGVATVTATSGTASARLFVRSERRQIRASIPQGAVLRSLAAPFEVKVASPAGVSRVTMSLDGRPEKNLYGTSASGQYFTGGSVYVAPDPALLALSIGQHRVVLRAYDDTGVVRDTSVLQFTVEFPTRRYNVRPLGSLGGSDTRGAELNERNEVAGWANSAGGGRHAVFWGTDGRAVDIGADLRGSSEAVAINESGVVIGNQSWECGSTGVRNFIWRAGQSGLPEPVVPGCYPAVDVNDAGKVVLRIPPPADSAVSQAVLWDAGRLTRFNGRRDPPWSPYGEPFVLTNADEILAGSSSPENTFVVLELTAEPRLLMAGRWLWVRDLNDRGDFIYHSTQSFSPIGGYRLADGASPVTFPPVSRSIVPTNINNRRQIVGLISGGTTLGESSPFLWDGGELHLVDVGSGWGIDEITDLNEAGVILAHGQNVSTGQSGAVLLIPTP